MVTDRLAAVLVAGAAVLATGAALAAGPVTHEPSAPRTAAALDPADAAPGSRTSGSPTGSVPSSLPTGNHPSSSPTAAAGAWPASTRDAAPAAPIAPTGSPTGYVWPTGSPVPVIREFDLPPEPWLAGHRGVDLAAGVGLPVLSAGDGTVVFAGPVAGRPVVSVLHDDGLRTTYEPVAAVVTAGQRVRAGELIGTMGTGSHCECLHWGARRGADDYVDPLALLRAVVRLLPD